MSKTRIEFEKWVKYNCLKRYDFGKLTNGHYESMVTDDLWKAYQYISGVKK